MMVSRTFSRRGFLAASATFPLAGCALPGGIDLNIVKNSLGVAFGLTDPPAISLEQAAQVPFSSLGYRLGDAPETMLILSTAEGSDLLWTSAQHRSLQTRSGRIVKTAGFTWNLADSRFFSGDALASGLHGKLPEQPILSVCDFPDIGHYSVLISSTFQRRGPEAITILGQQVQTVAVVENRRCENLNWEFQNFYWIDVKTGFVWTSKQTVHPNLDPLTVEILRPLV